MLRLLLATALVLPLSIHYGEAIVQMLMPLYRAIFERIGEDFHIIFFGLDKRGAESVIRVDIRLTHALVVGGHLVFPDPRGTANVTTLVIQTIQPVAVALIAALAWPCPSMARALVRLSSLIFFLLVMTALDAPFLLAGEMWGLIINRMSPGADSMLVSWSQFLQGGGRVVLGVVAVLCSLAVEGAFTFRHAQGERASNFTWPYQ